MTENHEGSGLIYAQVRLEQLHAPASYQPSCLPWMTPRNTDILSHFLTAHNNDPHFKSTHPISYPTPYTFKFDHEDSPILCLCVAERFSSPIHGVSLVSFIHPHKYCSSMPPENGPTPPQTDTPFFATTSIFPSLLLSLHRPDDRKVTTHGENSPSLCPTISSVIVTSW